MRVTVRWAEKFSRNHLEREIIKNEQIPRRFARDLERNERETNNGARALFLRLAFALLSGLPGQAGIKIEDKFGALVDA